MTPISRSLNTNATVDLTDSSGTPDEQHLSVGTAAGDLYPARKRGKRLAWLPGR